MAYAFRILFHPLGPTLGGDQELALSTGAIMRSSLGGRANLQRGGYATPADARDDGERHRAALYLTGPASGYPVDARDRPGSGVGQVVKDQLASQGVVVLDSPFGLQVFAEDRRNKHFEMTGTLTASLAPELFVASFRVMYDVVSRTRVTDEDRLALELFNVAHIDASPRARFLTFMTAVEVIAKPAPRSAPAVEFIEKCAEELGTTALPATDQDRLKNALHSLKTESIRSTCVQVVDASLGPARASEFKRLYGVRGGLAHAASAGTLDADLQSLKALVSDLLVERFRAAQVLP